MSPSKRERAHVRERPHTHTHGRLILTQPPPSPPLSALRRATLRRATPRRAAPQFSAGNQKVEKIFQYIGPLVTSVAITPARSKLPTLGDPRVNITLTGTDFGQPFPGVDPSKSVVSVKFGFTDDPTDSFIACPRVVRLSQTRIVCVGLPPGGGTNLSIYVNAAGASYATPGSSLRATFSYDAPNITEAYAVVFQRSKADEPTSLSQLCEVEYSEVIVPGVDITNYNSSAYNLTLWQCSKIPSGNATIPLLPTQACVDPEPPECLGSGFDPVSGLFKSATYVCPPLIADAPPFNTSSPLFAAILGSSATLRAVANSTFLVNGLALPNAGDKINATTGVRTPSPPVKIVSINGGVYTPAGWRTLTSNPAAVLSAPVPGPLRLRGPSRIVQPGAQVGRGSVLIVLKGANFGPGAFKGDRYSCPMMPWSARPSRDCSDKAPFTCTSPASWMSATTPQSSWQLRCDGVESFIGEGEVSQNNVVVWDDDAGLVAFWAPPGMGLKDVEVVARRDSDAALAPGHPRRVLFAYDAPQLFSLEPVSPFGFDTDGNLPAVMDVLGLPALASGAQAFADLSQCGAQTVTSACPLAQGPPADAMLNTFRVPLDLTAALSLPTAFLVVSFATQAGVYAMVSDARELNGFPRNAFISACRVAGVQSQMCMCEQAPNSAPVFGCLPTADVGRKPFQIALTPPNGVGGTIFVRLEVWDGPTLAPTIVSSSLRQTGRYLKPDVLHIEPHVLLLDDGLAFADEAHELLTLTGKNFGRDDVVRAMDFSVCDAPLVFNECRRNRTLFDPTIFTGYTGSSLNSDNTGDVNGAFGAGYPCFSTKRVSALGQPTRVECLVSPQNAKAGRQQVFLRVADQISNAYRNAANMDVLFACKPNYFAGPGGSCLLCPPLGATCAGYSAPKRGVSPFSVPVEELLPPPLALDDFFNYDSRYCGGGWQSASNYVPGATYPDPARPGQTKPCYPAGSATAKLRPLQARCPYSVQIWALGTAPSPLNKPRDLCIMPCHIPGSCVVTDAAVGAVCAEGYVSVPPYFRCAQCDVGWFMRGNKCKRCPANGLAQLVLIGYLVAIIAAVALAHVFTKYEVHVALLSLGVDFAQTVAMLVWSRVQWSDAVRDLFFVLSSTYLDVEIVSPECYDGTGVTSFADKFFVVLWMPVAIAVALWLAHFATAVFTRLVKGRRVDWGLAPFFFVLDCVFSVFPSLAACASSGRLQWVWWSGAQPPPLERGSKGHQAALVSSLVLIASLLYMYETENLLQVFNCAPPLASPVYDSLYNYTRNAAGFRGIYTSNLADLAAHQRALEADYVWRNKHAVQYLALLPEECGRADGTQAALMPYAVAFLILGVAGWPIGVSLWLAHNRELIMQDQLLRAKGQGNDRLSGPATYNFRKTWGRLYYQFKPECWFWQPVIYLRKFLFLFVILISGNKSGIVQMVSASIVLLCFYVLQVRVAPFMGPDTYADVLRDHQNKSVTSALHARLRAAIQHVEVRGKRGAAKPAVDFNGNVNRAAMLGAVFSALFDYNTVESVLLFVAILVCQLGVLTESHIAYYYSQSYGASIAVQFIVSVTIIYFLFVATWDMLLAAAAKSKEEAELRRRLYSKSGRRLSASKGFGGAGVGGGSGGDADGGGGSGAAPVGFHARAGALVDALTTTDAKRAAGKARKQMAEDEHVSGPMAVSVNPLAVKHLGTSTRNMPPPPPGGADAGEMPPPPPGGPAGLSAFASLGPGDLEALRDASEQFVAEAPPLAIWSSFRQALGESISASQRKDGELADMRVRLAEAERFMAEAAAEQAAVQAAQAAASTSAGLGALAFARQPSARAVKATASMRALKPQRSGSIGGGAGPAAAGGRAGFAPTAMPSGGMPPPPPPPPGGMPPPPPPPPFW